jgi:hypothetical protein
MIFIIFSINYIVDPYNLNNRIDLNIYKKDISSNKDYRLWKLSEFNKNNKDIIIFGDSRSDALDKDFFKINNVYNFSFVGSSLYESIDSFWYAVKKGNVKEVIFGLPFTIFNKNKNHNMFSAAKILYNNKMKYYINLSIFKVSIKLLFDNNEIEKDKSLVNNIMWKYILDKYSKSDYNNYKYPYNLIIELNKIKKYCLEHNIKLIIFIPPAHIDLQKKVSEYHLTNYYKLYKKYICTFDNVFDFEYTNKITTNKNNYYDPYHFNKKIAKQIVFEIENNKNILAKGCPNE